MKTLKETEEEISSISEGQCCEEREQHVYFADSQQS
jgi:hypothetical protein